MNIRKQIIILCDADLLCVCIVVLRIVSTTNFIFKCNCFKLNSYLINKDDLLGSGSDNRFVMYNNWLSMQTDYFIYRCSPFIFHRLCNTEIQCCSSYLTTVICNTFQFIPPPSIYVTFCVYTFICSHIGSFPHITSSINIYMETYFIPLGRDYG